jgi:hypothetical protein
MKPNISLYIFLVILISSCQSVIKEDNPHQLKKEDKRQSLASMDSILKKTEFGCVYITLDTNAIMYDWLNITDTDQFEIKKTYSPKYIKEIESELNLTLRHFNKIGLYPFWTKLNKYKGEYYVYSPSDYMANETYLITDSIIYSLTNPDPTINPIMNFRKISESKYEFIVTNFHEIFNKVIVELIDEKRKIYLWEFINKDEETYKMEYRTHSSNVKAFKMIVNDCFGQKCIQEFIFDN